jgi:hypothetical protein
MLTLQTRQSGALQPRDASVQQLLRRMERVCVSWSDGGRIDTEIGTYRQLV